MTLRIAPLSGPALRAALGDVARLRIAVFREWPYLYDGDPDYERRYLEPFAKSPGAVVVGAWNADDELVGAATGAPLEDHAEAFGAPFAASGRRLEDYFYCAESVLLPQHRGQGAGRAFFAHREAKARELSRKRICFCAVSRPEDHPARPAGYAPLDPFWRGLGYAPAPGLSARFAWKDLGAAEESEKEMLFWDKAL